MSAAAMVAVCAAGGAGAAARFLLDGFLRARTSTGFPVATMITNLSGSILLGLLSGLAAGEVLGPPWQLVAGTGFLGGYTTFSTASFETVLLLEDRRPLAAAVNGVGMLLGCVVAAGLGYFLGARLAG